MSWLIGRTKAMSDPTAAKLEIMDKLRALEALDDAEALVIPVMINAIMLVESHRAARHRITFLDDLSRTVDALIEALTKAEHDPTGGVHLKQSWPHPDRD
jgi:hypothetical protein